MLRAVKHQDAAIHTHGGDHIGVLGHVPCLVDFTVMVNLLNDVELYFRLRLLAGAISPNLFSVVIVVRRIRLEVWNTKFGNLEVIRCIG